MFNLGNTFLIPRISQLLKVDVDDGFSKLANRHLHEFVRQYMWKITTGMAFFVPFDLNVRHPLHDPRAKFPDRMQDFAVRIMIQPVKRMSCMHSERFQKLENVCVIYLPPIVANNESLRHFDVLNISKTNTNHCGNVDSERRDERSLSRYEETGSLQFAKYRVDEIR